MINLKIGTLLLYLFIICFYFCLFLLFKFVIKKENKNQTLLLIFLIISVSFNFILSGRDFHHKILYMPILFFVTLDWLNMYFLKRKSFFKFNYSYFFIPFILIYSLVPSMKDLISKKTNLKFSLKIISIKIL